MNAKDILWLSSKQLGEKKVRTALTILMVVIGVASIVALSSQTASTAKSIQSSLASLGPTSIIITPSGSTTFTAADVANLETLPNVSSVTPIVTGEGTVSINGNSSSATIVGISTSGLATLLGGTVNLYQGSLYNDNVTPLAVVGHSIAFSSATDTNLQTVTTGETATIEVSGSGRGASSSKTSVPIVGVLQSYSSSLVPVDGGIIVSMPFAEVLLHKTTFNEILVKANSVKNVSALSSLISTVYGSNARVENTQQIANTVSSISSQTTTLFIIIGGISLIVAAIGIMNVMLMAVSERIHEIGILKSIGFRSRDVLLVFLSQALFIGLLGGAVGLVAGIGASYSLSYFGGAHTTAPTAPATSAAAAAAPGGFSGRGGSFSGAPAGGGAVFISTGGAGFRSSSTSTLTSSTPPVFTLAIIAEAIIVAIAISAIAGIYPAWRASRMEPIDALRIL